MAPKKVNTKDNAEKKKKLITIEPKKESIDKHERGVRVVDIARQYDRIMSTICTTLKKKDAIEAVTIAKGVSRLSKQRITVHERMEILLLLWINEKQLAGDTITEIIICEKARALYGDLLKQNPGKSTEETSTDAFKVSRSWFDNFKKTGVHIVVRYGEAASSDTKAAEDFVCEFRQLIAGEGCIALQVFNCEETGLFWKKMLKRTYIMPGHKPMKDRLTHALCANASGDLKIKLLIVYHFEKPRAFKSHKILKEKLQIMLKPGSPSNSSSSGSTLSSDQ
ncbi:tigger transposable element-derived protein 1-like [Octopus bimaculoides]|uniref:tigger transposable element-derived protein 1-like n=1 Tax=Octopus bimaculoides TaxID=37653 RepID=UPI00071C514B|nr:tigger transposable element-derived protein 1-like [Octopus bimaculoides]|eukprot:XP_014768199.1 PREDICTED: tigger transposable element-derived protein 1-like [Octopus bimaculoides]